MKQLRLVTAICLVLTLVVSSLQLDWINLRNDAHAESTTQFKLKQKSVTGDSWVDVPTGVDFDAVPTGYTISGFDAFTTRELIAVDSNGALKARSIDSATWSDYNLGGGPLTIPTDFKLSVVADTMIFSNPNTGEVRWGLGFDPSTIYNNMPTLALPEGYQILGTFGVFNGGWDELVIINPTTGDVKRRKLNSTPPDSSWTDAGSVGPIPANHELVGVRYIVADRNNKTIDNSKLHVVVMTPAENDATYTVAYDDNGSASGTIPTDSNTYATDASVTVSENTGNLNISDTITFAGWNTKADGSGTNYAPGDTFNMGVENVTLFAQWKTTFEGDLTTDQTFIRPSTPADRTQTTDWFSNIYYAADLEAGTPDSGGPDNKGYTRNYFVRKIVPSVSGKYTIQVESSPDFDDTFLLVYEGGFDPTNPLTNVLVVNDDIDTNNTKYFSKISNQTLTAGTAYYIVMTTYKNGDAGHVAFSVTGAGGVDVSELSSSYTVTYDANGGTGTAPTDTTEYIKDDTVTVKTEGDLVKTGYIFAGWNTQADGSGKAYIADDIFTISTENITLYAQWLVETKFSGELKNTNAFFRPATPYDRQEPNTSAETVYSASDLASYEIDPSTKLSYERNYIIRKFVPSMTGSYTIEVENAELFEGINPAELQKDTFMLLYEDSFNSKNPLTNVIAANEDIVSYGDPNEDLRSKISNQLLTKDKTYYVVVTSSVAGITGTVDFKVTGPASVAVSALSSDATLSDLSLSGVTFTPLFDPEKTSYTAYVADTVTTVTATPTDSNATIAYKLNGTDATATMDLQPGDNTIDVIVTAQDGTTKTYTVTVTVVEESTIEIDDQTIAAGATIEVPVKLTTATTDSKAFQFDFTYDDEKLTFEGVSTPTATNKTVKLESEKQTDGTIRVVGSVDTAFVTGDIAILTFTVASTLVKDDTTTVSLSNIELSNGDDLPVVTTDDATLTVDVKASTIATLTDLQLVDKVKSETIAFNETFAKDKTAYTAAKTTPGNDVTVQLTKEDEKSEVTYKLNGVEAATADMTLQPGKNVINVIVTAEDKQTTTTYKLTVTMGLKGDADVDGDVDINDWQTTANFILNREIPSAQAKWNADMDDNNKVNISDWVRIAKKIVE